jgi:UDP-N-acetylmuramate dehydrogenase
VSASGFELTSDEPLAAHTSLGLGGPAQFFARLASAAELPDALAWAKARGLPVSLLGGGSNLVVADAGVPGLVLQLELRGRAIVQEGERVEVTVGAGESWDAFVAYCIERDWAGLECLSGIPGRVGATPIQNVGAYGQEVADCLLAVDAYDCSAERRVRLSASDCAFGYRSSRFKHVDVGRFIVLGATFQLRQGGSPCLDYPEIAAQLAAMPSAVANLSSARQAVLATRRRKSMVLDPVDENGRSCGSFFLNPQLEAGAFEELCARLPAPPPSFSLAGGGFKVPAAWLIERAGFQRGQRWGPVGISTRHTLALVCHAGATSAQLLEVAHRVRDGVAEALGVWLNPEPTFLGFAAELGELPALA